MSTPWIVWSFKNVSFDNFCQCSCFFCGGHAFLEILTPVFRMCSLFQGLSFEDVVPSLYGTSFLSWRPQLRVDEGFGPVSKVLAEVV